MNTIQNNIHTNVQNKSFFTIERILILILVVLIIGFLIFSGIKQYQENTQTLLSEQLQAGYNQGVQVGYEQAIVQIMTEAPKCTPVPVFYQNQTINMIAVECPVIQEALQVRQQLVEQQQASEKKVEAIE